jgi:catechol 2,3-dioxygenase-like lactoylglutathione lyase family enzyme
MSSSAHAPAKFHVSLNVADVARSAGFYRKLFQREPAKQTKDYAKFELDEPPLVLSLISGRVAPGGNLNHIGIRLPNSEALIQMQIRLETAGIATKREEGVECCHSRQTKFWVTDPDRTLWELYIFHEHIEDEGGHAPANQLPELTATTAAKIVWQHQIPGRFPVRIPYDDNSVHEVVLQGTANLKLPSTNLDSVLAKAYRVLRPGGEVRLHGLAGDKPSGPAPLNLPGPAALVHFVPMETEPMKAMIRAGFVHVRFEKLSPAPNFIVDGVQMREILLAGLKPGHRPHNKTHQAVYLGPLAQVADDFGNVFPRGERVTLNIHDWQVLALSSAAGQFLFLPPDTGNNKTCC